MMATRTESVFLLGRLDDRRRDLVLSQRVPESVRAIQPWSTGLGRGHRNLGDLQAIAKWESRLRSAAVVPTIASTLSSPATLRTALIASCGLPPSSAK